MDGLTANALLDGLDADQRRAVSSDAATLCVLAGAGSGKTLVLTRRVARRIIDTSAEGAHTLVLTFTRKAADELRTRLDRLDAGEDVTTGTFHAVAYAELRRRWLDQNRPVPIITSQPARVLDTVLDTMRLGRTTNSRVVATEIAWAKSRRLTPETYEEGVRRYRRRPPLSASQLARVYEGYELEKRRRRTVDYDDLLMLMTDALLTDKAFATTQRWKFRHIFVDEFQDLNKAQFDLLRAWLGDREDLFVVGDPNQAIYGWNGAEASFMTEIEHHFPKVETIRLPANYRSSAQVLVAANAVLPGPNARRPETEVGVPPVVRWYANEQEEAAGIARQVRAAHGRSWRWSDIAILVRTNAQRTVIEQALDHAHIPFRSAGGAAWLYRSEVKEALGLLREMPRIPLAQRAPDIEQMAQEAADGRGEYLDELTAAIRQCLASEPDMTIADFLAWVEVASKDDAPALTAASGGAVTVTTFHRAKGLEWDVVFLAGVEDGLVPLGSAQLDEEQRLFYVAITRARAEVHCSWAQQRMSGNGISFRAPSPWLAAIEAAAGQHVEPAPSLEVVHEVIEETRTSLQLDLRVDAARQAIERWRAARAKLSGVDAKLILTDTVIEALLAARPQSKEELGAIEGFGAVRAMSIGDELLPLLHLEERV